MSILEEIADSLARDALRLETDTDDLSLVDRIAREIGATSPTVEEAFKTAVRMRRAERKGQLLIAKLRKEMVPEGPAALPSPANVAKT